MDLLFYDLFFTVVFYTCTVTVIVKLKVTVTVHIVTTQHMRTV